MESSSGGNSEPRPHPNSASSSNSNHAGPSSIPGQASNLSYTVEQPAPQQNPFQFHETGERGDLLRTLQRLVSAQLRHYFVLKEEDL